jgi:hypothetical protein
MGISDLIVIKQVKADLNEGRVFYDSSEKGIGDYFYDTLVSDIESLWLYSGIHPVFFGLHRMLSKRFPFAVYYTIRKESIIVVAVLDLRRNPAWIREKLKSRKC